MEGKKAVILSAIGSMGSECHIGVLSEKPGVTHSDELEQIAQRHSEMYFLGRDNVSVNEKWAISDRFQLEVDLHKAGACRNTPRNFL